MLSIHGPNTRRSFSVGRGDKILSRMRMKLYFFPVSPAPFVYSILFCVCVFWELGHHRGCKIEEDWTWHNQLRDGLKV